MSGGETELEAEVSRLTVLVERLTLRVVNLEDRLREVEDSEAGERSRVSEQPAPSASGVSVPSSGWSAVSSIPVDPTDQQAREELARHIGRFLRRGLNGDFRGSSGRDRLRLQNRHYLIVKDFSGRVLPSPVLASSFSEVKATCKRGSDCGAALFVGFATLWEARLAVLEAGLELPPALRNV